LSIARLVISVVIDCENDRLKLARGILPRSDALRHVAQRFTPIIA
jgi:hypothetical protein